VIDIEFAVYNAVTSDLKLMYPDVFATGDLSASPARFPAVSIVEINNSVLMSARTAEIENAVSIAYEVNVYSNKVGYNKIEAKEILAVIDESFKKLGFSRTFCNPVQNLEDKNIYRIVSRYEAIVDRDLWIYQK
jgi:hypothetical protein